MGTAGMATSPPQARRGFHTERPYPVPGDWEKAGAGHPPFLFARRVVPTPKRGRLLMRHRDERTPVHYGRGRVGALPPAAPRATPYAGACRASVRPGHHANPCRSAAIPPRAGVESDACPKCREAPSFGAPDPSKTRWQSLSTPSGRCPVPRSGRGKLCRICQPCFPFVLVKFAME